MGSWADGLVVDALVLLGGAVGLVCVLLCWFLIGDFLANIVWPGPIGRLRLRNQTAADIAVTVVALLHPVRGHCHKTLSELRGPGWPALPRLMRSPHHRLASGADIELFHLAWDIPVAVLVRGGERVSVITLAPDTDEVDIDGLDGLPAPTAEQAAFLHEDALGWCMVGFLAAISLIALGGPVLLVYLGA